MTIKENEKCVTCNEPAELTLKRKPYCGKCARAKFIVSETK